MKGYHYNRVNTRTMLHGASSSDHC